MNDTKYIGLDVHQATISVAVLDSAGKLVMEAVLETKVPHTVPVIDDDRPLRLVHSKVLVGRRFSILFDHGGSNSFSDIPVAETFEVSARQKEGNRRAVGM